MKVRKVKKQTKTINNLIVTSHDHAITYIALRTIANRLHRLISDKFNGKYHIPVDPYMDEQLNGELDFVFHYIQILEDKIEQNKDK